MRLSMASAALLLAVPAGAGDPATLGQHKDWNSVDQVEILKVFQLSGYSRMTIQPFDKSEVKLPPETENTYAPTREAVQASDIHFVAEFRKKLQEHRKSFSVEAAVAAPPDANAAPQAPAEPAQAPGAGSRELILRGKLLKLAAGSKAARYFVGFGAGASGAQYQLELVDGTTNEVLVRFMHEKRAGTGMLGGNYVDVMTRSIKEVASDVAKSLDAF